MHMMSLNFALAQKETQAFNAIPNYTHIYFSYSTVTLLVKAVG